MAAAGPVPKLMLFLDLDFTHFNTANERGVVWLGKEQDWLDFYGELIRTAKSQGVELLFAVISKKLHFDDIAEQAAVSFKDLLSIRNPDMYFTSEDGLAWCLVNHESGFFYECINYQSVGDEDPPSFLCESSEQPPHFVIASLNNKSGYMLEIAEYHDISPECCLLLDDTPDVLLDATLNNIQTVSFSEFCPTIHDEKGQLALYEKLQDPNFFEPVIQAKRQQIREKVQQMIQRVLAKTSAPTDENYLLPEHISPEEFCQLKKEKDPNDCLHSWGSFRLLLGINAMRSSATIKESAKTTLQAPLKR